MNFNENDLWRDKTKLLNFRFSKLHSTKVLLKLENDTKDQVLSLLNSSDIKMVPQCCSYGSTGVPAVPATIFMSEYGNIILLAEIGCLLYKNTSTVF